VLGAVGRAFVGQGTLSERQGSILVATAGVVFSVTAIAFAAVESASEFQFLAYRGGSTAVAMLLLIALRARRRPVNFRRVSTTVVIAGIMLGVTSMLYILALSRTTAATTLFLLAAAPIVAAVIGWLALGERVEPATTLAIAATLAGVIITVGAGLQVGSMLGLAFAGLIPLLVGTYSVLMRSASDVDPVIPTLIAGLVLGLGAGAVALAQGGLDISVRDAALACVSGGVALGCGLPMFNLGHRSVAAARIPLLLMTEVVLAPLWVWIWPGEVPSIATLIGGAVILGSVAWLVLSSAETTSSVEAATATPTA